MQTLTHPVLVFIRGLPGSGKTYIAKDLRKKLEKQFGDSSTVMLDPDATDYTSQAYAHHVAEQTREGVDPILHPYRFLRAQAYEAITSDKILLWNQPFTSLDSFQKVTTRLHEYATEHSKDLPMLVVEVEVNPEVAKQRVEKRKATGGHGPSDKTFTRFTNEYASFKEHGFNTLTVNGEDNVDTSSEKISEAIQKLT